jgi:Na+/melibiose symporter-like transporter
MARDYSRILRNRQFVLLGVTGMLISMVITIMQSNLVLYIKYAGGGSNEFVLIIVRMQCGLLIGLFATASTANYMDKRMFLAFALFVWAMVLITINFSGGMPTPAHEIVFGACAGVAMVMIDAMLPDVIDVATDRRSGASRPDALYYAWFGVFQKLGAGIAMSMLAAIVGANTGDAISASDDAYIRALKIVYTTVSPAVLLLSLVPLYFYKITRDTQLRAIGESANTPNIVNDEIVDL